MSQLTIILDTSLKVKDNPELTTLTNQENLDITNPDNYCSEYEYTNNLIKNGETNNNFINCFISAYNLHKPILIKPDDIKLQLLTIVSTCINNNAEAFRSFFVNHEGKEELVVHNSHYSSEFFTDAFAKLMTDKINNPEFAKYYTDTFSTTTRLIQTVNNMTLMNTLKEYFSFTMVLECGIPSVILSGTIEDWNKLKETYNYFKSILLNTELANWFKHFDIVMDLFIDMRNLKESGIVEGTYYMKSLFKRVISYVPEGSGNDKILGGWIRLFVPYTQKNKVIKGLENKIPCLDLKLDAPSEENYDFWIWQDKMKQFYIAGGWTDMMSSCLTTPAKLIFYDSKEYKVEFYSGFFNPCIYNNIINLNIGYVLRENQTNKKKRLKQKYLSLGVKEKEHGSLLIPRVLRKEAWDIIKYFDKYGFSLYGVDPKEEELKQYYMTNGVYMDTSKFSKICNVPKIFEDKVDEIKEVFQAYRVKIISSTKDNEIPKILEEFAINLSPSQAELNTIYPDSK